MGILIGPIFTILNWSNIAAKRIVLGDWGATGWYLALNSNNIDLQEFNI